MRGGVVAGSRIDLVELVIKVLGENNLKVER